MLLEAEALPSEGEDPRETTDGRPNVLIVDDDPLISRLIMQAIFLRLRDEVGVIEIIDDAPTLTQVARDLASRYGVWLLDLNLHGLRAPLDDVFKRLEATGQRKGVAIVTGDSVLEARRELPPSTPNILVHILPKPFDPADLMETVSTLIDFVVAGRGAEASSSEDDSDATTTLIPVFGYPSLMALYPCLSEFDGNAISSEESFHLARLIDKAFLDLRVFIETFSFEEFRDRFYERFPLDDRRTRMLDLLKGLEDYDGARIVVRGCIHDINNLLQRRKGKNWEEQTRGEIKSMLDPAYDSFSAFVACRERDFSRRERVADVLEMFENVVEIEGLEDLPEALSVHLPAGVLRTFLSTFLSNAKKMAINFRLRFELKLVGGHLRVRVFDDLEPFHFDQLKLLGDAPLRSHARVGDQEWHGTGRGLEGVASEVTRINEGAYFTSFHYRDAEGWMEKRAGEDLRSIERPDFFPVGGEWTKAFEFTVPVVQERME